MGIGLGERVRVAHPATTARGRVGTVVELATVTDYPGYVLDSDSPGDPVWPEHYLERIGDVPPPLSRSTRP